MKPHFITPTRTAFRALTPEQQQTIVSKLGGFSSDWSSTFADLEHEQNEAAAELATELAAEFGEDAVQGALERDRIIYEQDAPTVSTATETYHATLDFPAITKMVAEDMKDVRAAAEMEEAIN